MKKTYAAFLYPQGEPLGFRDGTLLKNKSDRYIISHGEMRKFADIKIVNTLGFPIESFREISIEDLKYNPQGKAIDKDSGYPDYSIFHIQDDFYRLENNQLEKFVSDSAFSTYHQSAQAIEKNLDFLKQYNVSEKLIGFSEGTLLAYADSIYVVENGKIYPIDNPLTFSGKGFDWNDVKQASADEIAIYEKSKLFTISNPHPSGTVFTATENYSHYLIIDKQKRLLPTEEIYNSWINITPISISQDSLDIRASCQPKKSLWHINTFQCELPIANVQDFIGSDYIFSLRPEKDVQLDLIDVEFKKDVAFKNFEFTVAEILNRIKNNYAR